MVTPAPTDHIVQIDAAVNVQGHSIGGVMQQCLGFSQVEPFDFCTVDVWLDVFQRLCERGQVIA